MSRRIIETYEGAAAELVPRYSALDSGLLLREVFPFFPPAPARVLDIGAGTGRDAAWLAQRGFRVTAVEPVALFREVAGKMHGGRGIRFVAGELPRLPGLGGQGFDLLLLCAIWHHLDGRERALSFGAIRSHLRSGGRAVLSLRQGPAAPDRPAFPIDLRDCMAMARGWGLKPIKLARVEAQQEANRLAGVRWTWLVLEAV